MTSPPPQRKYRIERYLAEGGMGAIYIGKKLGAGGFEKDVVLKQLLPEYTSRPEFRDLFFREAKISASLDHTNIVRTFDLVAADEALFIVMEYVRGADLRTIAWRARLRRKALSPNAVLHVGLEILAGLAYAHSRRTSDGAALGIIHRDVSPSNILCSAQGDVKLSDFGIAKATTFSSVFYRVRGKVGYMSPEQASNQPLDARSDLFSMAVVLFETLTGERLFTGDLSTPPEVVYGQEIPRLSQKRADLPPELEPVFDMALARDPQHRFQTAALFAAALRDVARRYGLLYSAPELAAELDRLLGSDPDRWSQDDSLSTETERIPVGRVLEGREAEALALPDDSGPHAPAAPTPARPEGPTLALRTSGSRPALSPPADPLDLADSDAIALEPASFDVSQTPPDISPAGASAQTPPRRFWLLAATCVVAACVLGGLLALLFDRDAASEETPTTPASHRSVE